MKSLIISLSLASAAIAEEVVWQPWSDTIFKKAAAEHKLVLLDLGAVWCHWCHVMDEVTYTDPAVRALLAEKYIAVRVDQDARPDLANRYEDYGWPATVIFRDDGTELAKRRGNIPPQPMAAMLKAFIDDPTPGPSAVPEAESSTAPESTLTAARRKTLRDDFIDGYDSVEGGWGSTHKYLNWDSLEYSITEGLSGDLAMEKMARQTLTAGRKLIDPVWGGVYQYSTDGDWDHTHFEKIIPFQAENLRIFSLAACQWHEPRWLDDARKIRGYLRDFLTSPEGAFYTSQDADLVAGQHSAGYFALDDAARRKLGIPRVDTHLYSRENGLVITGLAAFYAASGDESALADAEKAAGWVIQNRALPGGGYRHDANDASGPYLADTLAMGRAFLALYTVTADRKWLAVADDAAAFIDRNFHHKSGFASAAATGSPFPPKPQLDENVALVRFANLLHAHTGKPEQRAMAEHAMRYLASNSVVDGQGFYGSGILLADREIRNEPTHITIVGGKNDPAARALFNTALRAAPPMSCIEWFDRAEGGLPRTDIQYPEIADAVAYTCTHNSCSLPVKDPGKLTEKLDRRAK